MHSIERFERGSGLAVMALVLLLAATACGRIGEQTDTADDLVPADETAAVTDASSTTSPTTSTPTTALQRPETPSSTTEPVVETVDAVAESTTETTDTTTVTEPEPTPVATTPTVTTPPSPPDLIGPIDQGDACPASVGGRLRVWGVTEQFEIMICADGDNVTYFGRARGQGADGEKRLAAVPDGDGYLATTGSVSYRVNADMLEINVDNETYLRSWVTGPFGEFPEPTSAPTGALTMPAPGCGEDCEDYRPTSAGIAAMENVIEWQYLDMPIASREEFRAAYARATLSMCQMYGWYNATDDYHWYRITDPQGLKDRDTLASGLSRGSYDYFEMLVRPGGEFWSNNGYPGCLDG